MWKTKKDDNMDMNIERIKKRIELRTKEKAEYDPEETTFYGEAGRVYENRTFWTARFQVLVRWLAWDTKNPEVTVMMCVEDEVEMKPAACFRKYIDDLDEDVEALIDTIFKKDDVGVNVYERVEDALSTLSHEQIDNALEGCHAESIFDVREHLKRELRPIVELMISDAIDDEFKEDILDTAIWRFIIGSDDTHTHLTDWLKEHKTI